MNGSRVTTWRRASPLYWCNEACGTSGALCVYSNYAELGRWRRAWYLTIAKLLLLLCESDLFNLSNTRIRRAMLLCHKPSVRGDGGRRLPESCTNTTTATWLILPVVICLSKRLSHASLSINTFCTVKLQIAH